MAISRQFVAVGLPADRERVTADLRIQTWYCYAIVHPVSELPIYVGMTSDPHSRCVAHTSAGPVKEFFKTCGFSDKKPEMVILGRFDSKDAALEYELSLFDKFPGLLNKATHKVSGACLVEDRGNSAEQTKPWLAEGISRRTWYRNKQRAKGELPGGGE